MVTGWIKAKLKICIIIAMLHFVAGRMFKGMKCG